MNNKKAGPTKPIPHEKNVVTQAIELTFKEVAAEAAPPTAIDEAAAEFCVQSVRARIASYIADGTHSLDVVNALYNGSTFLPQEGYLFDYKHAWPVTRAELAKYAKHVAAFHNVFGGFIFFGVEEVETNKLFRPCVDVEPRIDYKQFNDLLREYLASPVEVTIKTHTVNSDKGERRFITVLHIPKRAINAEPNVARKDLMNDKGKTLIKSGEIYIRDGDNSIAAHLQQHWKTIYGQRHNPYLENIDLVASNTMLENNLPDRSLIYGEFVGRTRELEQLWSWFSDDFSRVRVLAGEGGLGKTSIAYEFASDFCRTVPVGFDCVIWLTAKKRQFRALENSFEELGLEVFETTSELLRQMGESMGLSPKELAECPDSQLPRLVKQASTNVAALVVIDDLDSLELDEQKRCIEICQQFSTTLSRFLFTTRKNVTASSASSIEVEGFITTEFKEFIEIWKTRLALPALSGSEVSSLLDTTGGSPLFTESILRLLKLGMPLGEALKLWSGHLGIEVRNAVLKREVMQLGMEARKILALVATLGSCSFAEVKLLSSFTEQTISDASNELQSLFLLSTPPIAKERRFAVSSTTRQLVRSLGSEFLPGFDDFVKDVRSKKYRAGGEGRRTSLRSVSVAIHQAMAQIADDRSDDAVKTVDEVNKQLGGKNADLLSVRARALATIESKTPNVVRKAFEQAYDAGQRKEVFFDHWYRAESKVLNWDGAIQVIDRALQGGVEKAGFWILKRLEARFEAASGHKTSDVEHAVNQVRAALRDFEAVAKCSDLDTTVDRLRIRRSLERFGDLYWDLPRASGNFGQWLDTLERLLELISLGDQRYESYIRAAVAFVGLRTAPSKDSPKGLVAAKLRELLNTFSAAPDAVNRIPQFKSAYAELQGVSDI